MFWGGKNLKDIITVVTPCYNVEKYIIRCLRSIENQTYGFENIELILVDDASTDNTLSLLNAFKNTSSETFIPSIFIRSFGFIR